MEGEAGGVVSQPRLKQESEILPRGAGEVKLDGWGSNTLRSHSSVLHALEMEHKVIEAVREGTSDSTLHTIVCFGALPVGRFAHRYTTNVHVLQPTARDSRCTAQSIKTKE